jgi:transposase
MDVNKILKIRQFKAKELEEENGEILIFGELKETQKSCPKCRKEAIKPHQYHSKKIRTVPFNSMPTYLIFTHIAYLCSSCGKRFLERVDFFDKCQRHTIAYKEYIYELAKKQDINRVAELEGLSWDTVNDIFLKGREKKGTTVKE